MSAPRVRVQWTETAKNALKKLPLRARQGILSKADELYHGSDPRSAHKPMVGPLLGLYSMTYARYRALYSVHEDREAGGVRVLTITIQFVLAGIRKAGDRHDIYEVARRLVTLGVIETAGAPATTVRKRRGKRNPSDPAR